MKYLSIIILALAIYFGAARIGSSIVSLAQTSENNNLENRLKGQNLKVQGENGSVIPLNIRSNSADFSFSSELIIGEGSSLVVTKNGKTEIIKGTKIIAEYYHHGKVLTVEYLDADSNKRVKNYNSPDSWMDVK